LHARLTKSVLRRAQAWYFGWMKLSIRTQLDIAASRETVFDLVSNSRNFARFFRPFGPIPGVDRVELLPTGEGELEHRAVFMSDASRIEERVLVLDRPRLYRYRWLTRPTPPLHLLMQTAQTEWRFEPAGARTHLLWNYEFELTSRLVYPAAWLFSKLFERWMIQALARIRDAA
jgi:uncharacterized protein YndB with AHSA1/START domain